MANRKKYIELSAVVKFMEDQPDSVNIEYGEIVEKLEAAEMLEMPLQKRLQEKIFLPCA